ncbi:MAG: hypothetical protein P4L34_06350 [Paludibacter sp.]|nr:hypothetical protein [Paludibacter sp.]
MAAGARIPRSINEFGNYIVKTNGYISTGDPVTNGERLGLLPVEITQWKAFETQCTPLLAMYNDITNSRTRAIRNNIIQIIDNTIAYDQSNHILDRIAASPNATIYDLGIFNINGGVLPKTTRTIPTVAIRELVSVTFQILGGAMLGIKCYSTTGSRAAIFGEADCVQILYQTGTTPPASTSDDTLKSGISTKASFNLTLNPETKGKYLYIYFRWYNTKHPELAGPWSELQSTMIM